MINKQELSEQGLGRPLARYDRGIDVHPSSIRHKLGLGGAGRSPIQTVRGAGYRSRSPTLARGATDAASEASKHSGVTRASVG